MNSVVKIDLIKSENYNKNARRSDGSLNNKDVLVKPLLLNRIISKKVACFKDDFKVTIAMLLGQFICVILH